MEQNVKILGSTSKNKNQLKKITPCNLIFQLINYFPSNLENIHYHLSDLYVLLCIKVNNSFRAGPLYVQISSASGSLQITV